MAQIVILRGDFPQVALASFRLLPRDFHGRWKKGGGVLPEVTV
ncbi:hypothetical protein V3M69_01800 [Trueperella pyogenes]|nr:hypothetical protein [Trueperella pyogenes]